MASGPDAPGQRVVPTVAEAGWFLGLSRLKDPYSNHRSFIGRQRQTDRLIDGKTNQEALSGSQFAVFSFLWSRSPAGSPCV